MRIAARGAHVPAELELRTGDGLLVHARVQTPARPALVVAAAPALHDLSAGDSQLAASLQRAQRAFACGMPVLLSGETGSGKEWTARMLHATGPDASAAFTVLNCATLHEASIQQLLDATGTVFLDEIGELPAALQPWLLRVLRQRESDGRGLRLVGATLHEPPSLLASGRLRVDLYYCLNGLHVALTPLREHGELATLVREMFRHEYRRTHGRDPGLSRDGMPLPLAPETWAALLAWHWPGNFRELRHVALALALAAGSQPVGIDDLPPAMRTQASTVPPEPRAEPATMREVELHAIEQALAQCNGNVSAAARRLGISRNTMYRRLGRTRRGD
jgi:transcriptional regulator of acetoin/glycerol metabolism